jgi:phage shock protein PspC (stress-responsive transcriptional regulator)
VVLVYQTIQLILQQEVEVELVRLVQMVQSLLMELVVMVLIYLHLLQLLMEQQDQYQQLDILQVGVEEVITQLCPQVDLEELVEVVMEQNNQQLML